ncbi:MAG TPA: DUF6328 family protein [Alphaproteobacteria bacterium]
MSAVLKTLHAVKAGETSEAEAVGTPQKVKLALQETRILVLGTQVLLGFAYQAFFYPAFDKLTETQRALLLIGLALLILVLTLLLAPTMFHRLAYAGYDDAHVYIFANRMAAAALLPFALAIGLSMYVVIGRAAGDAAATALGGAFTLLALGVWYAAGLAKRKPEQWMSAMERQQPKSEPTPLRERIERVMSETRIILPGVQALLGFQFAAVLTDAFERLPESDKLVHVAGLAAVGLSVILLMAPAAYHRLVTGGEATSDVLQFAHYALLASMVPLAFSLAADFYIVLDKVLENPGTAAAAAAVSAALMLAAWFALPLARRAG